MIKLIFNTKKGASVEVGDILHIRIKQIEESKREWPIWLVDDITPLPEADTIYSCDLCGIGTYPLEDGSLPEGWVRKEFPARTLIICTDCNKGAHEPYCRVCGCTQHDPCPDNCYWIEEDLCSTCFDKTISE
jgi:hypothetical protein